MPDPAEQYAQALQARQSRVAHYDQIHIQLGNFRLLLAVMAAVMAWAALSQRTLSAWWLAVPLAAFAGIAVYHSRILRARDLAERAATFYRDGLARMQDRWEEIGEPGDRFDDPHHVYASDLDLFGKGNLFQLLSTARTRVGEEMLANWLLAPSPVTEVRERHAAISELRELTELREDLAVLGRDAGVGVHPEALVRWAEAPNRLEPMWLQFVAPVLALAAIAGAAAWNYWSLVTPLVLVLILEGVLQRWVRKPLHQVLHGAEHAFHDLSLLSAVLARMETQAFQTPSLLTLQERLSSSHVRASEAIDRLSTITDLIDSRDHLVLRVLDLPLLYSVQVGFAAERWRRKHGHAMRSWLTALGEMEALVSLATYSFEHPADPFPEFIEDEACFEGEEIGHPLIPAAKVRRNSVSLCRETRVLLVSGSNMSGKSTLLRAVGLNAVLAMTGAPVRAKHLRLTPLHVGASIRINDSLHEGSSRFYSEITRLRKIVDLTISGPPLLFLLDEVLQGTNSRDRRIGAEGVVKALVGRGAIGLVSTHDLSLAEIGGPLHGRLQNVHFQDEIVDGRMKFDYKLRDGIVTKSNGLELMRSIGLDV